MIGRLTYEELERQTPAGVTLVIERRGGTIFIRARRWLPWRA